MDRIFQNPVLISGIVWVGVILSMGFLLKGTQFFDQALIILGGVAAAHLIFLISLEKKE